VRVVLTSGAGAGGDTESVAPASSMDAALAHLLANPTLWEGDLASLEDEAEEKGGWESVGWGDER
jgi:hypothetical protein